jgi:hypothetical protein
MAALSSESTVKPNCAYCLFHAGYLCALLFNPEDGKEDFLQNVGSLLTDEMEIFIIGVWTMLCPRSLV